MGKPENDNGSVTSEERSCTPEEQETKDAQTVFSEGDDVLALRAQLEEKEKEAKANYELFLRERAENENFKRRMQKEKVDALRFANEPLIKDILPVLDNLERAVSHAQGGGNGQSLVDGVSLVLRSFLETLEKYDVSRVSAKGQPFDPSRHEAMAQVETPDAVPNTIVEEYAPAYFLHDRLIRPALVTVAKAPPGEKKTDV
ncbi:MAG: nucleotide exchange factor GrpE [Candidatus Binatia bacterium]